MHSLICKLFYFIYSPVIYLWFLFRGVKLKFPVYFAGFTFLSYRKQSFIEIGKKCRFMSLTFGNLLGLNHNCILATEKNALLKIGDYCSFSGVSIWCFKAIEFGNNVRCGANVTIIDGDAHSDDPRSGECAPVLIEDNVWIGKDVTILKGVRIGRNTLIGANSVVTKDIPANVVAAGNPCKKVKDLSPDVILKLDKLKK